LGAGIGQNSASSADNSNNKQGFQFNPNAGVSFNFGTGQGGMAPMGSGDTGGLLFSAGSAQTSGAPSSSSTRVFKKARRRVKN
jgi:hypothetical protein